MSWTLNAILGKFLAKKEGGGGGKRGGKEGGKEVFYKEIII